MAGKSGSRAIGSDPMAPSFSLAGKVALVTGAAQGIGLETARRLAQRGASVALLDLDLERTTQAATPLGDRALALAGDVTDAARMEAAVGEVVERFGGLDVVVANAGVAPPTRPMTVVDNDAYERTIEIDLLGVWRTVRPALPQVVERRGHVVVVASVYAFLNGAMASPYAASKAAVEQLGRALRAELAIHGASASVAYFGFIDTAMVRDAFEDPIAKRIEDVFPAFMMRRLTPAVAGEAIVAGVERRAPRIIRPRWWRVHSVMRGVINPLLDARMERDQRLHDAVRDGERFSREESP
jgi:NAD(P)-dependent dehydrogenase (short-subunit alcohol dehydrogenase family)